MANENFMSGDELSQHLEGLQMMQPAIGTPGAGVIDGLKSNLNVSDGPQAEAPSLSRAFDIKLGV